MFDKEKGTQQEKVNNAREINLDDLEQVVGAGNPFKDIPRNKVNDYDDDIKKKI